MVHFRYSRWSGTQRDGLDSDSVFEQLNDYMNDTGDLQQAMRRLMQKGMKGEKQTKGIDDLLSQVAKEMRKLYDEYRLQSAMDEVQDQLESIVDQERQTLEQMDQEGNDVQDKKQFLNDLPGKSSEAIEKLTSYRFENADAAKEFEKLVMQLEQIRKLENWLRREGSLFRGQTPMQFQQSQELMERMEDLRKLESQLSSMQLKDVDQELLERLLGGDPKQDFEGAAVGIEQPHGRGGLAQPVENDAIGTDSRVTCTQATHAFSGKCLTVIDQQEIVAVGVSLRDVERVRHGTWKAVNT